MPSQATMQTSEGAIGLELFDEDAPETVANFRKLAGEGFYDGIIFHRVIPDFMIQSGCPQGTGTGGPGYTFKDEINEHKIVRGALAMANAGPNTNGSQFFIVTTESAPWLDGKHTVFGRVNGGVDLGDAIEGLPTGAGGRPVAPPGIASSEGLGEGGRRRSGGRRGGAGRPQPGRRGPGSARGGASWPRGTAPPRGGTRPVRPGTAGASILASRTSARVQTRAACARQTRIASEEPPHPASASIATP